MWLPSTLPMEWAEVRAMNEPDDVTTGNQDKTFGFEPQASSFISSCFISSLKASRSFSINS